MGNTQSETEAAVFKTEQERKRNEFHARLRAAGWIRTPPKKYQEHIPTAEENLKLAQDLLGAKSFVNKRDFNESFNHVLFLLWDEGLENLHETPCTSWVGLEWTRLTLERHPLFRDPTIQAFVKRWKDWMENDTECRYHLDPEIYRVDFKGLLVMSFKRLFGCLRETE